MTKQLKPIPIFTTYQEEAEFWDTHDAVAYMHPIDGNIPLARETEAANVTMTIRVESSLKDTINRMAKKNHVPASSLVRKWVKEGVRKLQHAP